MTVIFRTMMIAIFGGAFYLHAVPLTALPVHPSSSQPPNAVVLTQTTDTNAQIYIFRGAANVFSLGMDELAGKLKQLGYSPKVMNWKFWRTAADEIATNYWNGRRSPIILIGHSLGADVTLSVAQNLREKNIPVDYIATFDVTKPLVLSTNVLRFVNFYQNNGFGMKVSSPAGYRGEMINVDLSDRPNLNHGNIDEAVKLHELVISKVQQITTR